ncbi:hypothetical protein BO94DRAFT_538008, partial [Aspergillus sclerotioniger CBS 115572]
LLNAPPLLSPSFFPPSHRPLFFFKTLAGYGLAFLSYSHPCKLPSPLVTSHSQFSIFLFTIPSPHILSSPATKLQPYLEKPRVLSHTAPFHPDS